MDSLIQELEDLTNNLIHRLNMTAYEELVEFVEHRQRLIDELLVVVSNSPLTSEQKDRVQVLLECDPMIVGRMSELKNQAGNWLQQRNKSKTQQAAYEDPYDMDAVLMDRKR